MKKVYLVSIFMALVVGIAVYLFASSLQQNMQPKAIKTNQVVMAAVDIPANTQLTKDMLVVVDLPVLGINPRAATKLDDVVGMITRYPLSPQEQVLPSRLNVKGEQSAMLSYNLEAGQRALSVGVDDVSGISGYITKGDYVDVVATIISQDPAYLGMPISTLLVENLLVLQTGINQMGTAEPAAVQYATVTLSVTPDQALLINYAADNGKIRLILRPVLDNTLVLPSDYPPPPAPTDTLAQTVTAATTPPPDNTGN